MTTKKVRLATLRYRTGAAAPIYKCEKENACADCIGMTGSGKKFSDVMKAGKKEKDAR